MSKALQIATGIVAVFVVSLAINAFLLPPLPSEEDLRVYMASPQYQIDKAAAFRAAEERAKYNF